MHHQTQQYLVGAKAEDLVPATAENGVEEDAAEGDLGPTLVTEGVVDGHPDDPAGDQMCQDQGGQDDPQVVPLPGPARTLSKSGDLGKLVP